VTKLHLSNNYAAGPSSKYYFKLLFFSYCKESIWPSRGLPRAGA